VLDWLYNIVGQVLVWIHSGLSIFLDPDSGLAGDCRSSSSPSLCVS